MHYSHRRRSIVHEGERGYNLVEVLVATAVTAVVIMSIFTVITLAQRNVYSGKQMTAANSVATRVLEDLSLMSATDVVSNFNLPAASSSYANNTVAGQSFSASILRTTQTIDSTTDPSGYLSRWQTLLGSGNQQFLNPRVVLVITPGSPINTSDYAATAQVIRIRGFVEWNEGSRRRNVSFEASKLQRP